MSGLFNLFIRSIDIEWARIERNSYLRDIPALAGVERIDFKRNITFFVGENGTGKSILLGIPGAEIFSFDDGEMHPCRYEDTESYQVTEMFINNRKALTERLLSQEQDNF